MTGIVLLSISCSDYQNDNLIDLRYEGTYRLHAAWSSLPDTLYHNTAYTLACKYV
jgi:hypothetical protein